MSVDTAPAIPLGRYVVNGCWPRRIVEPATEDDVAAVLAEARAAGQAVVPAGGGTMLQVGDAPNRYDLALSTRRLSGIVEYNPADLTVVVRAGTTLSALNAELGAHGQFLPLGAALPDHATIGGILASNAGGIWRAAFGSARDMVIGMRMALPDGTIACSGGRVVKNVAGYDLSKLFVGSFGTLGVIVEAAFKVFPRPAATHLLLLRTPGMAEAFQLARQVDALGPGVLTIAVLNEQLAGTLHQLGPAVVVMVGGPVRAAADLVQAVRALPGQETHIPFASEAETIQQALQDFPARAILKISTLPSVVSALALAIPHQELLSFPASGLTFVAAPAVDAETITALRERIAPKRGSAVLLHAPQELRHHVGTWGESGSDLGLMGKIKDVFDPDHTMSPGRFVGGL